MSLPPVALPIHKKLAPPIGLLSSIKGLGLYSVLGPHRQAKMAELGFDASSLYRL